LTGVAGAELATFAGAAKVGQFVAGAGSAAAGNAVMSQLMDAASGGIQKVGTPLHYAAETAGVVAGYGAGTAIDKAFDVMSPFASKAAGELAENSLVQTSVTATKIAVANGAEAIAASQTQGMLEGDQQDPPCQSAHEATSC
jgi:hypothetical protein